MGEGGDGEVTEKTLDKLEELAAMDAPAQIRDVFGAAVRFDEVISPDGITAFIAERYGQ